jgi:predicted nuclease with RNAse H fold
MLVVGIDLAGVENRQSGFCILRDMKAETMIVYSDDEIIRKIEELRPKVIAIDAPLSLPKGRKSIDEKSSVHLRECDKELLKRGIKFFPITLGPMRLLTKRGIRLKEILKKKGFLVIEVYPGAAQDIWKIPRKQKGLEKLMIGLKSLGIKGLRKDMSDDELDAVTCALIGKLFLEGKCEILGSVDDGIVIPKMVKN